MILYPFGEAKSIGFYLTVEALVKTSLVIRINR
jgi:hypothetical protein